MAAPEVKKNSYQDGLLVYWKNDKKKSLSRKSNMHN
jgi:hypothetical protein